MSDTSFGYSVIVSGNMNPAIHHPAWYEKVGLLGADEVQVAIESPNFVATPQISQFPTARFQITCTTEHWQIQCDNQRNIAAVNKIAIQLFDTILPHTPVNKYGIGFTYHILTKVERVESILAKGFQGFPFASQVGEITGAALRLLVEKPDHREMIRIEPSNRNRATVFLAIHFEYGPPLSQEPSHFLIGPTLQSGLVSRDARASSLRDAVVNAINATTET